MYRIRFHGRGGQGMKTASRFLGNALFLQGYEVQDAPRYGAERRGAPVFAYVRADQKPVNERGIINRPDLVVVADDSLLQVPAAGVMQGVTADCVLVVYSQQKNAAWQQNLQGRCRLLVFHLGEENPGAVYASAACFGAAARLLGVIDHKNLEPAVREELLSYDEKIVTENLRQVEQAFELMAAQSGAAKQQTLPPAASFIAPDWLELPLETVPMAAPAIRATLTSELVPTGLWRTERPVLQENLCHHCTWLCGSFCPDGAISRAENGQPVIDYEHCKGCLICLATCPLHALQAVPEAAAGEMP